MSTEEDFSGITAIVRGDAHAARRLRATLAVIARRTDDPDLRAVVTRVLAGRENVRRALTHPSLAAMAARNLDNLERGLERLTDEERDDVMSRVGTERTPDDVLDEMREPTPTSDGRRPPEPPPGGPRPPTGGTW